VANESAGVDIPDGGNFVAIQIELRAFRGAPVGSDLRKFADNQGFDIRARSFFVIEIGANVADVGIGQANNLTRVTGVGENFLIAGETGIKNDFAAAARDRASRTAIKYAPVFEGEYGGSMLYFRQWVLRCSSFAKILSRSA
jgi:hypothetical protein